MNNTQGKTFSQMLRERREFVSGKSAYGSGGGNPLVNGIDPAALQSLISARSQYLQGPGGVENAASDQVNNTIHNGQDGVAVSPAAMLAPLDQYIGRNEGVTSSLLSSLASLNQSQAQRAQELQFHNDSLNQSSQFHNEEMGLRKAELGLPSPYDDNKSGISGIDAVNKVNSQGGSDLLDQATTPAEKFRLAQGILAAGGVGNYRKSNANPLSKDELDQINGTNTTLKSIRQSQSQIKNSKALQSVFDNPVKKYAVMAALASGNQAFLHTIGLSDEDVQALSNLTALNAQGERQLVGGKLSGYLSNKLSPAQPGLSKSSSQNLQQLKTLEDNITNGLKSYAKTKGYNHYADIPGIEKPSLDTFK